MPAQITHFLHAASVYNALPVHIRLKIRKSRKLYNIGSQGPDIFFYYLPGILRKKTRGIGSKMHKKGAGEFFSQMATSIAKIHKKDAAFAYLCGFITHYCLDCVAHPYVYYKTGFKRDGEAGKKIQYSSYHFRFETAIDTLMLKLVANQKPAEHKFWKRILISKSDIAVLNILGRSISKAYGMPISGKNILWAMRSIAIITKILTSSTGKKKKLINLAETAVLGEDSALLASLIHDQNISDDIDYLNSKKEIWKNPWDENSKNTSSFLEMFNQSADDAQIIIEKLYNFLYKDASLESFLEAAGDKTLFSGENASSDIVFKIHDIVFKK